jgi:hypothetical protein
LKVAGEGALGDEFRDRVVFACLPPPSADVIYWPSFAKSRRWIGWRAPVEVTHRHSSRANQRVHLCWADVQIPSPLADREEGGRGESAKIELRLGLDRHGGTGVPASQPRRRYRCPLGLNRSGL